MKSNEEILQEIHHAKSHSKSSKKIYKNAVKQYCKYNKLSLSELIKEADEEEEAGIRWKNRKLKKRLINFRQELIKNYKKNTIQSYFNAIRSIYHYFEIEIHDLPALNITGDQFIPAYALYDQQRMCKKRNTKFNNPRFH